MLATFEHVENYLNSLINYESRLPLGGDRNRPKLQPTLDALDRLGLSRTLPECIHIAGTKGKGSVVSFLEALLSPDHRVLSFSSPHLTTVKERVRFNGKLLEDALWCDGFSVIAEAVSHEPSIRLSYFEATFVFYVWAAKYLKTGVHIVEAGLGGRWDATNVLEQTLPVLTLIDYDHTDILGNTLTEIASDKAGIIKPGASAVIGRQSDEAKMVIERSLLEAQGAGQYFGRDYFWLPGEKEEFSYLDDDVLAPDLQLRVAGTHQLDNAAIAIRAARMIEPNLSASAIRERLADSKVLGRQQLMHGRPNVLVDVAHNPVSFAALAGTLRERFEGQNVLAVVGLMKDKDARACFQHLKGLVSETLVVVVNSPRSYAPEDLAAILGELGISARVCESREVAFQLLHDSARIDLGLVTGSFYLVGDYLLWRDRAGIA